MLPRRVLLATLIALAGFLCPGQSTRVDSRTGVVGAASSQQARQVYAPAPRTEAPRNTNPGTYGVSEDVDEGTEFTPRPRPRVYYDPRILQSLRDAANSPRTPAPPPQTTESGDLLQRQGPQQFLQPDPEVQQPVAQRPSTPQTLQSAFPQTPPFHQQRQPFDQGEQIAQGNPQLGFNQGTPNTQQNFNQGPRNSENINQVAQQAPNFAPQQPPPVYQQDLGHPPVYHQHFQAPVYQAYPQAAYPQQPPPAILFQTLQNHQQHNHQQHNRQQQNQQQQNQQLQNQQEDNFRRGYHKKVPRFNFWPVSDYPAAGCTGKHAYGTHCKNTKWY